MEVRANYVLVGASTLAILAVALIFTLWIAKSGQRSTPMQEYEIAFEESVSGLSVNNDVLFTGIKVGTVSKISISKEKPGAVLVRVSIAADTPVRQDSEATLQSRGVTGVSVISITAGSVGSPFLEDRSGHPPVIRSKPSPLSAVMNEVPAALQSINQTLQDARGLFTKDNQEAVAVILESMAALTSSIASQQESLNSIIANVNSVTKRMDAFLDNANKVMEQDVRAASRSLASISKRVDTTVSKMEPGLTQFSNEGLAEFRMLTAEARTLVRILTRISQKLENDPRRYFFGEPVKEYTAP